MPILENNILKLRKNLGKNSAIILLFCNFLLKKFQLFHAFCETIYIHFFTLRKPPFFGVFSILYAKNWVILPKIPEPVQIAVSLERCFICQFRLV